MSKDEQIALAVQTLAEIFRVQLTPNAARGYLLTLEELSGPEVREAERRARREFDHMPSPAQFLRLGLKARRDGQISEVARTNRMLDAMKPSSYPTAEQLAEMRDDWKRAVAGLADEKAEPAKVTTSIHPGEAEARRAIAELEARLAAERAAGAPGTSPEGTA